MFNLSDLRRDQFMLTGPFSKKGYDWWWHSFTGISRATGEEKAFFIEFFACNPALGGNRPSFGQISEDAVPSYLMVKAGCWGEEHMQLHRFFGWDDVTVKGDAPFSVSAGDCYVSDNVIRGSVDVTEAEYHPEWMCDNGSMSFSLLIDKQIAYNVGYGAGEFFRKIKAFEMYWHAEGMKTMYEGTVTLNGVIYDVIPEKSYGYADKNWGRNFTSPWVWLSAWDLKSTITGDVLHHSVFDIGGGRPKVFFVPLDRKLLGAMYYEGKEMEFNFSKFWMRPGTKFSCEEMEDQIRWHVIQNNREYVMVTEISCEKKDMLFVNYESPDGKKRHKRLWNGGTGKGIIRLYERADDGLKIIDEIEAGHIGCEYGEY